MGVVSTTRQVVNGEGVGALWKGVNAAWLREASYTSLRLGLYEPCKIAFGCTTPESTTFLKKFAAGSAAGALGWRVDGRGMRDREDRAGVEGSSGRGPEDASDGPGSGQQGDLRTGPGHGGIGRRHGSDPWDWIPVAVGHQVPRVNGRHRLQAQV